MKNKIYAFSFILLLTGITTFGQAPSWQWAKSAGGTASEHGLCIAVDASGNSYVTGGFLSSSVTFGSYTLVNAGVCNVFIVKYDPSGNVVWAKCDGGNGYAGGWSIKVDVNGNLHVAGYFSSDSITLGNTTLFNAGSEDIFIAKYDAFGNLAWAKSAGGIQVEYFNSIAVDAIGNSYITGSFFSPSITFGSTTLTNAGILGDVFFVKYDASGSIQWAKSAGGTGWDEGFCATTDINGNSYITGNFSSISIAFGTTTLINTANNNYDIFIVKYDVSGNIVWAKSCGGTGADGGYGISVDINENPYITGSFESPSITFGTTTLTNSGNNDIYIAKFDVSGNALWAKSAGGSDDDYGWSIALDTNKNSYVAGWYNSPVISLSSSALTNAGNYDIFILKYDVSGNELWGKSTGGGDWDEARSIATDASENSYITGMFGSPSISFDGITLTNAGNGDVFVSKLNNITGIEEQYDSFNAIKIFPNPVTDQLTITTSTNDLSEIILYDIASRKLLQQKFTNTVTLNTAQLAKGMYVYEVRNENGVVKKGKVVKE